MLAVAGREIVLHARIASKRRRLHRGKAKKEIKKEGKREQRRRREWRKMEDLEELGGVIGGGMV